MLHVSRIMSCLLLLGVSLCMVEARWTHRPWRTTTTSTTSTTPSTTSSTTRRTTARPTRNSTATSDRHQHVHHWPPLVAPQAPQQQQSRPTFRPTVKPEPIDDTRLVDGFDQRSPDGQHEFRYQLSNGDTRYERTYWLPVGKRFVLARTGYYSVPLPNAQYSTVFYRADHQGYHVDTHTLSGEQPLLPRSLDVPNDVAAVKSTPAAKRNSISVPERNDFQPEKEQEQEQEREQEREQDQKQEPDAQPEDNSDSKAAALAASSQTKPSTVATLDDIFAAKLGTAAAPAPADDDNHDDEDDDDGDGDDDVAVAASNINVN